MTTLPIGTPQQMWRLSPDRRSVRLQLPPLKLAGMKKPVDIHSISKPRRSTRSCSV
jgi:hypothetical protein